MLLIMLRLRIYIENTTDIMFPAAVTINCQSLGLGVLRRFLLNPKKWNGTARVERWTLEPAVGLQSFIDYT